MIVDPNPGTRTVSLGRGGGGERKGRGGERRRGEGEGGEGRGGERGGEGREGERLIVSNTLISHILSLHSNLSPSKNTQTTEQLKNGDSRFPDHNFSKKNTIRITARL